VAFLDWLQNTSFITWVHESESLLGYTLYLAFHTVGMVFLVGPSLLIAARVLGLAPGLALKPLASFRPVMAVGFWITLITGAVLFATAGGGYVHNVVFVVKIIALVVALACLRALLRELFDRSDVDARAPSPRAKALTVATMLMWTIGVVAGRLTAYSGVVVVPSVIALLTLVAIVLVIGYVAWWTSRRSGVRIAAFRIDMEPTPVKGGK